MKKRVRECKDRYEDSSQHFFIQLDKIEAGLMPLFEVGADGRHNTYLPVSHTQI